MRENQKTVGLLEQRKRFRFFNSDGIDERRIVISNTIHPVTYWMNVNK